MEYLNNDGRLMPDENDPVNEEVLPSITFGRTHFAEPFEAVCLCPFTCLTHAHTGLGIRSHFALDDFNRIAFSRSYTSTMSRLHFAQNFFFLFCVVQEDSSLYFSEVQEPAYNQADYGRVETAVFGPSKNTRYYRPTTSLFRGRADTAEYYDG